MFNNKNSKWEKETPWYRKLKTNFRLRTEQYNRKTHGLGMILILMMCMLIVSIAFVAINTFQMQQPQSSNTFQRYEIIIGGCQPHCYQYE